MTSDRATLVPGGAYRARENEDGSWHVFDVPIFAETEMLATDGKTEVPFTKAWLLRAVGRAQERFREDRYLPPLHVNHTSDPRGKRRAGFYLPHTVRALCFDGGEFETVFADLMYVPAWAYEQIRRGELPYVSIESGDVTKGEISSCALMPDTVPHHKFPLLTIGTEIPLPPGPVRERNEPRVMYQTARASGVPVLASASRGYEFAAFSRFPVTAPSASAARVHIRADGSVVRVEAEEQGPPGAGGEQKRETSPESKPEGEKGGDKAYTLEDVKAALMGVALTLDDVAELGALLDAAKAKLAAPAPDATPTDAQQSPKEKPPVMDKPSNQPTEPTVKAEEAHRIAIEAKAKADAADARIAAIEAAEKRRLCIEAADAALVKDGFNCPRGSLEEAYDKVGENGVKWYADMFRATGRKAPPRPGATATLEVEAADLPSDFEFSAEPEARAKQIAASRAYDGASQDTRKKLTRKQFIEASTVPMAELARRK